MSTTGHLKLFSITTDHKSPIEDELPKPTQKMKKHPNSNSLRHTMFRRGTVEQDKHQQLPQKSNLLTYKFTDPTPNKTWFTNLTKKILPIYCPSPKHLGFNRQTSFFGVPICRVLSDETMNCFTTKWTHEQKQWRLKSFTSCSQDFSISHHSLYK
jgi:hypothetical protein